MPNNESTKRKHSTILLIGVVISFLVGFGIAYNLSLGCCTVQGVRYCPCKFNLDKLSEAIGQLKATREQLKEVPEQFKQVPEQLREVLEKLENTRTR